MSIAFFIFLYWFFSLYFHTNEGVSAQLTRVSTGDPRVVAAFLLGIAACLFLRLFSDTKRDPMSRREMDSLCLFEVNRIKFHILICFQWCFDDDSDLSLLS